jgi:pilus assembly protein CpaF
MRREFSKGFARPQTRGRSESEADDEQVRRFKQILLDEVDLQELSRLPSDERRARLERVLAHLISREGVILSSRERSTLVRRVVDEAVGLGVLEPLLADDTISEIMINGHETVYVERFGRVERIPSGFTSEAQLLQTIDRIVSAVNRRVDESSPMVDARLPADARMPRGARVNVVLPPLSLGGPAVTIRLFPKAYGLVELLQRGTLDRASSELLSTCVRARLNIIVSGGTASGKTTLLNALSQFVPGRERIVTVEDAAELSLNQEHVIRLETRPPNVEGRGDVTIRDLVRNSLRMRPDRIIVGEVRGGEALDMLQAMNTGHEGSLATVHANNAYDALSRIETLATMSDVDVPFVAIRDQVNSAIDLIVQLTRHADGTRRIVQIAYLVSSRRDDYELVTLADFDSISRTFRRYPAPPKLVDALTAAGESMPADWSGQAAP